MSVASTCARLRQLIEEAEPTVKAGRRFRCVVEPSPHSARHMTVTPVQLTGQGTYTGPCYAPRYAVAIHGCYPTEQTDVATREVIVQDAVDLLRAITRPPNMAANPWHNIQFAAHSVEEPDEERLYYRSTIVMEVEQA